METLGEVVEWSLLQPWIVGVLLLIVIVLFALVGGVIWFVLQRSAPERAFREDLIVEVRYLKGRVSDVESKYQETSLALVEACNVIQGLLHHLERQGVDGNGSVRRARDFTAKHLH